VPLGDGGGKRERPFAGSVEIGEAASPDDFSWLPAWALIADGRLAEGLRLAQDGAHTLPESCARVVLGLLALEHQGRHVELVENRRRLRDAHPSLFERYMQDR
jgi:hypothetical protein